VDFISGPLLGIPVARLPNVALGLPCFDLRK
jgi:hypothetical protein